VKFDYINDGPFVTANFKYRSISKQALDSLYDLLSIQLLEALQALRVVPEPLPLEERPEEELSLAELVELVRRLKVSHFTVSKQSVAEARIRTRRLPSKSRASLVTSVSGPSRLLMTPTPKTRSRSCKHHRASATGPSR
jgi:hypothetical protein